MNQLTSSSVCSASNRPAWWQCRGNSRRVSRGSSIMGSRSSTNSVSSRIGGSSNSRSNDKQSIPWRLPEISATMDSQRLLPNSCVTINNYFVRLGWPYLNLSLQMSTRFHRSTTPANVYIIQFKIQNKSWSLCASLNYYIYANKTSALTDRYLIFQQCLVVRIWETD